MSRLTLRLRVATFVFLLALSEALVDQARLQGGTCPEASGGVLDDVQLVQRFVSPKVEGQHEGITVMKASKTVQLSMDGQVTASARPVLTRVHWPDGGPDWINNNLLAAPDKTVAILVVGVSTMAVLVILCLRVPLPGVHRRHRKAVELAEVGEAGAIETGVQQVPGVQQMPDAKGQGCREEAMASKQTLGTPSALSDLPTPVPRLHTIGASYVVPIGCIKNARGTTLSFDIPTLPAVWPLRVVLTRATQHSAWTKIELTVDVIAAAEVPPLLSCTVCAPFGEVHQQCSQTTGGTGGTTALDGQSDVGVVPCSHWLAIRNSGGAILASVMPKEKDPTKCVLQRQNKDRVSWDVDMRLDEREPLVVVSQLGQEIGQATSLGYRRSPPSEDSDASDDEEEMQQHFQFDTQPQAQTPESLLLLMTFLAMVSFQPTKLPQEKQE